MTGILGRVHRPRLSSALLGERPDLHDLMEDAAFQESIRAYAERAAVTVAAAEAEVAGYLEEMVAAHTPRAVSAWRRFGGMLLRAYDVLVDEDEMARLRALDRSHSLALVFSHRSYLDGWVLPHVLQQRRFTPTYTFGGANLDLPVIGPLANRTGVIFIRRTTKDLPGYRMALRGYIDYLVRRQANLAWSIEGGRTRTGKLRPPVHGILRYLSDATELSDGPDVMVVPVSIVYDQLHEVARMTAEARGRGKRPEDLSWLLTFARSQGSRLGRAYVSVGEPLPLRQRLAELRAEGCDTTAAVERVALDLSHRINRATPVTVTAIVSLALLGADRALTFERVLVTVEPLARYIRARHWPVAGAASLTDRATVRRALHELVTSGVLTCFDLGTEPVWQLAPGQHLTAAFYRNTAIHILVGRAIGEVALLAAEEAPDGASPRQVAWEEAMRLRDLLKFEFFFSSRREFEQELLAELALLAPGQSSDLSARKAQRILTDARPHLAHLVLRPFVEAYLLVADRLAAAGGGPVDEDALLEEALQVGQQWQMERRIASEESVSLELFRTGLRLARHRGLVTAGAGGEPDLARRRGVFLGELRRVARGLADIAALAAATEGPHDDPA